MWWLLYHVRPSLHLGEMVLVVAVISMITSECVYWAILQLQESVKRAAAASVSNRVSRWRGPPGGGGCHCRRGCGGAGQWGRSRWKQGRSHSGCCCRFFVLRALESVATGDWAPDLRSVHNSKRSYDDVYVKYDVMLQYWLFLGHTVS